MKTRGAVMIYMVLVIAVILTVALGTAELSMGALYRSRSDQRNAIAFNAAQATLELGITQTLTQLQGTGGVFQTASGDVSTTIDSIAPGVTATWSVTPSSSDTMSGWITASATYDGRTKSIRSMLIAKDLSIWNNAVFGGTGMAGKSMNGNVDVRGSVHLLGDGEPYTDTNGNAQYDAPESFTDKNGNGVWDPGESFTDSNGNGVWDSGEPYNDLNKNGSYDPPLVSTDLSETLSGAAYMGNNYAGVDATLASLMPTPPTVGGKQTLSAELRVQHGRVSISGSAAVGAPTTSSTTKYTMDGVYVSDGFTGNSGASSVYSDNGTSNAYDVSALDISMPILSGIGAQAFKDSSGTVWTDEKTYLNARSLSLGKSKIEADTSAFSIGPDAYGNSISFTPASGSTPATLNISGIVKVSDGFQLGDKDTIRYTGNGSFWCPGSIDVDCNFLPASGYVFPTTARVGMIAEDTINLASGSGSSQLTMTAAFYAQNRIYSAKQNNIGGTFVSNYFDMGSNVPKIAQVPSLRTNLPPAMPGTGSIIWLKQKSWRERQ